MNFSGDVLYNRYEPRLRKGKIEIKALNNISKMKDDLSADRLAATAPSHHCQLKGEDGFLSECQSLLVVHLSFGEKS